MWPLAIVGDPFSRITVDWIGPLKWLSPSGKRYFLTIVDYAARYPEAVEMYMPKRLLRPCCRSLIR